MTAFAFQHIYAIQSASAPTHAKSVAMELLLREFKSMKLEQMLAAPWVFEAELVDLISEKAKVIRQLMLSFPTHQFFINISPCQAASPDFLPALEAFTRQKVPASSIALEITENWLNESRDKAIAQLLCARQMGYTLVVDDFGAGNLTLAALAKLNPAIVKLDRSMMAASAQSKRHTVLIQSVVRMIHDIGAKALAEGIETPAMLDMAGTAQCDFAQGFFLDRPSDLRIAKIA
jgi:EAL domain-containing protein (putative c-di-GMP-specific phosphodiesterase class I)